MRAEEIAKTGRCPACLTACGLDPPYRDLVVVNCPACKSWSLTSAAFDELRERKPQERLRLSWLIRARRENDVSVEVNEGNLSNLIAQSLPRRDGMEVLENVLLYVARESSATSDWVDVPAPEFPLFRAIKTEEVTFTRRELVDDGLAIEHPSNNDHPLRLTPKGRERAEYLRRTRPDSGRAFVARAFRDDMTPVAVLGFQKALIACNYEPVDLGLTVKHDATIDTRIVAEIRSSGLVVADFTHSRPSVYFEAGLAQGLGIPVIRTVRDEDFAQIRKDGFDVEHYPFLRWTNPEDLCSQLTIAIRADFPRKR